MMHLHITNGVFDTLHELLHFQDPACWSRPSRAATVGRGQQTNAVLPGLARRGASASVKCTCGIPHILNIASVW